MLILLDFVKDNFCNLSMATGIEKHAQEGFRDERHSVVQNQLPPNRPGSIVPEIPYRMFFSVNRAPMSSTGPD